MAVPTPSPAAERQQQQKQEAANRAAELVESGMVVGLGGGSTAALAIRRIAELLQEGRLRDVAGVPRTVVSGGLISP